ncbi:hypothetical protein [Schaalia hyovaginalis]|uniref:Uncharacterized protein n=1 Tax=Schaalia hyovaginalis TaxID=29316 RepID=A0A923E4D2_9ACTO|nr:hypothetical protein [Schaalia hyovaginalis]MBB6333955.1 hypothetical protein [Schaalia hyovaginalis]MDY2669012.1 hypothetical protein [Schaalia hyovaginalis]
MATESEFDTESVTAASNTLDARGTPAISTATDSSSDVLSRQNPTKWGTERGPSAFSPRYSAYLSSLEREMATMRDQLASFIESVRQVAVAVENNEADLHDAFHQISTDLDEQPDAPTRPYGHEGADADPTIAPESEATPASASAQPVASSSEYSAIGPSDGTGA